MSLSRGVCEVVFLTMIAGTMLDQSVIAGDAVLQPVITRAQIESDWVLQDRVRGLPPLLPGTDHVQVTTTADAAGGCDGVIDGTCGFHTGDDTGPWWQVDLGNPMRLDRVVIYNRGDGASDRALRLEVQLSVEGQEWDRVYQHDGTPFLGAVDQRPLVVPCAGSLARWVRIQLPGKTYLHLDEIQVYRVGCADNIALRRPADQSSVSAWSTQPVVTPKAQLPVPDYPVAEVVQRGLRLVGELARMGIDVAGAERELLRIEKQYSDLPDGGSPEQRKPLYFRARWAVRKLALRSPLLDFDDLLLVKRVPGSFTHMSDQYYGWFSRPGGGLCVLKNWKTAAPHLQSLTDTFAPGSFLRPDISYDGQRVLFAYCKYFVGVNDEPNKLDKSNIPEEAFYHLYEMRLDGSNIRRLTHGNYDDFDGRYLPDGRIVFLSTRRGQALQCASSTFVANSDRAADDCYVRCGGGPERPVAVYTLHAMDADGGNLVRISPFEMFEWTPSVDNNGQIIYARWDYVDRDNMPYESLWATNPDGTNARAIFGNYTRTPHGIFEARSIPDSQKLIFTASGHHALTGGSLVLLDPNRGLDGDGPMQRLTPEVVFPESEGWPQTYFANPYPLSERQLLVAWSGSPFPRGTPHPRWGMPGEPNDLGIYLFDTFGNLNLIYRDAAISSMYPLPIGPRHRPPRVASAVVAHGTAEGRILLEDVYRGLDSVPRGTIRQLRLVAVPAKTHPTMNFPNMGITHDDPGKAILGTVPVEPDGSALFRVPAGVAVFFQALDADGMAVQTMRSATYVQPGQTLACIGCHEPRSTAPPITPMQALAKPASRIKPGPSGSWPLDYYELVQPVLNQRCVSCHTPKGTGAVVDLTAEHSYDTLVNYGTPSLAQHVMQRYHAGFSVPNSCAARSNALWQLLAQGHHDVRLDRDERQRLIVWMDTYGQRAGAFSARQADELRLLRERMAALLTE